MVVNVQWDIYIDLNQFFVTHCLLHHSAPIWTVLTCDIDGSRMISLGFGRVLHVKFLSIAEPTTSSFKLCQPLASSHWVDWVVDTMSTSSETSSGHSLLLWLQKRKTGVVSGPVPNSLWGRDTPLTVSHVIPCTKRIIIFRGPRSAASHLLNHCTVS